MSKFQTGELTPLGNVILGGLKGFWNRMTGQALTGAEQAANQFSAEQAELAFQREMEASNSQYQRRVEDLKAAGLNPMYASGQSVSLPSASNASSVSPSFSNLGDLVNMMTLPLQAKKMMADIKNVNAQTENIESDTVKKEAETSEIGVRVEQMRIAIEGSKLDNEQKGIVLRYAERMQEAELDVKRLTGKRYEADVRQINRNIEYMDVQELEAFVRTCDYAEHIQYLMSQEKLNNAQCEELAATVKKLNEETKLIGLNVQNFDLITVVGSSSANVKAGPFGTGESHPVTLADLKANAEKRLKDKEKHNSERTWSDIKGEYPE